MGTKSGIHRRFEIGIEMIFIDLIQELNDTVRNAVHELFDAAWTNQTHPQDLLLVDQHGFHDQMLADVQENPYVIGLGEIGYGERTFYEFIDWYRKSHSGERAKFEEQVENDQALQNQEKLLVQIEQSIYLRYWEADSLLKRYCQLTALACGEPYDWHLEIPVALRRGGKSKLIRTKIRNRIKDVCPHFYELVKGNYIPQLRNAFAHSQYYIIARGIHLLNYSKDPAVHAPCKGLTFDKWYRIFHITLLMHKETIGAFSEYRKHYKRETLENGKRIRIRITAPDSPDQYENLGIRHDRDEWIWHNNLNERGPCKKGQKLNQISIA